MLLAPKIARRNDVVTANTRYKRRFMYLPTQLSCVYINTAFVTACADLNSSNFLKQLGTGVKRSSA